MEPQLKSLKIDRSRKRRESFAAKWIIAGVVILVLLGAGRFVYGMLNAPREVEVMRVSAPSTAPPGESVILNATGYIVAAHKIQVASKVLGRVAWIGVEKGDRVKEGQVIVRLEDDEYRAQLQQAQGRLASLQARLAELEAGSRPQEIERARADLEEAEAGLRNSKIVLDRVEPLVRDGVQARSVLDDARARYDRDLARVNSLKKVFDLVQIGPRKEQIAAMRGQVQEARGEVAFYETQLANTLIRAPVTGTILERIVEKGEFVTTSFVGERGAKGFVASLANLKDLQVELDINQNDFARLKPDQRGIITTDAYPDRKYDGVIDEIAPEANRQKATVQVKVKVLAPDEYLRPEMNASVAFVEKTSEAISTARPAVSVPPGAVRNGDVFLIVDGKAARRPAKTLTGGEEIIANPPEDLKEGDRVSRKQS
jgi:HlyD family secretion protein